MSILLVFGSPPAADDPESRIVLLDQDWQPDEDGYDFLPQYIDDIAIVDDPETRFIALEYDWYPDEAFDEFVTPTIPAASAVTATPSSERRPYHHMIRKHRGII